MIELLLAVAAGMFFISAMMISVSNAVALGKSKREGAQLALGAKALDSYLSKMGVSIQTNGTAVGFASALNPTAAELKAGFYLPQYLPNTTPFGGTLSFIVRRGPKNDLLGFVCDSQNITERGATSPHLAGEVVSAAGGAGLRTSIANPGELNGAGFTGVASPINGPAIVCAWAYLPNAI